MGLSAPLQFACRRSPPAARIASLLLVVMLACAKADAQLAASPARPSGNPVASPALRARSFLDGRTLAERVVAGRAMAAARRQQAAMVARQQLTAQQPPAQQESNGTSGLNAVWQPLGPNQVASIAYGSVTGRVTAIAIDPDDPSGNTVYLGTTGGGV